MGLGRAGVAFLIVAALAGCGDDDGGGGGSGGDNPLATQQDAQAKSDARNLVTYVEACFVDSQDYTGCGDAAGTEDVGEATVEDTTAATFVIVSPSESGNEFRLTREKSGSITSTCTESGKGGCPASGEW